MAYYLLRINKCTSPNPTVVVLTSINITRREDQARAIYNNKDAKHVAYYGNFDPATDMLLPVNANSEISAFCFFTESLAEEEEDRDGDSNGDKDNDDGDDSEEGVPVVGHIHEFVIHHICRPLGCYYRCACSPSDRFFYPRQDITDLGLEHPRTVV